MKRKAVKLLAVAISAVMLAGCGGNSGSGADNAAESKTEDTEEDSSSSGKTDDGEDRASSGEGRTSAVFADTQCPTSLDLADSWNSWYTSRYGITETLYKLDENLEAQPFLAESCEKHDDTTWVITLRDDVTFQNGEKMTAESVKACWERTMGINARFNELLFIDAMEPDGQTLTVTTAEPVPAFVNGLTEPLTGIIDVSDPDSITEAPIGTGPFKAVSYEVKKQAQVERYEDYWGGTPKLESVTFNVIADTNSLAMAQQTGESDLSVSIPGTSLELFSDTSQYYVDGVPGSRGQVIFLNFDNEFLQDVNVRKAISMSIDKKNYAQVLNKGASVSTYGLYPDFMAYGADEADGYAYDLEGAEKLLEDAGYDDKDKDGIREKDGKPLSLRIVTYSTKAELPMYCEEMASKLKEIGIDLKVEVYESVAEQQESGDFDLMMISFTMCPTGDPLYFANIAFKTGGSSNYGHYSNTEVDKLIDQMTQEFDTDKRAKLAKEAQKLILEDAGFIVAGHSKYIYVMGSSVKGLHTNPSEYYLLDAETYIE